MTTATATRTRQKPTSSRSAPPSASLVLRETKEIKAAAPRIYTKPLRELTSETSNGFDVIEFAEKVCRINLYPWQKWLLIHMLELLPDNSFRFRTLVVLVARQNGKTTVAMILALWFMYRYDVKLVLGTAQDLDTAEEVWQNAVDLVDEVDELRAFRKRVVLNNGKKSLDLFGPDGRSAGPRYKVKAANRRAGRGLSGELVMLDELREHQTWDAWAAITKTTMAKENAIILALSNAGDATSVVLRYLRRLAHQALGDPDGIIADEDPSLALAGSTDQLEDEELDDEDLEVEEDTLGLFEWSAPKGCQMNDRAAWKMANPSLGHGITIKAISAALRTDKEWVFRTEVLCQWSDSSLQGLFEMGSWEKGKDPDAAIAEDSRVVACVDIAHDRSRTAIAFAGRSEDGRPVVEIVAYRAGTEWVIPWLTERMDNGVIELVTGQARGAPVSGLLKDMAEAGLPVHEWGGSDLSAAFGQTYDSVRDGVVLHRPQPILDVAEAVAVSRPLGDGWVLDRKSSSSDISSLVSFCGALWLLERPVEVKKTSAYERSNVQTV